MNIKDAKKLKPGHRLDALVAIDVLGWKKIKRALRGRVSEHLFLVPDGRTVSYPFGAPAYSTDLASAIDLLDSLRKMGHRVLINIDDVGFHLRRVALVHHDGERDERNYNCDMPLWTAKTQDELPKGICLSALRLAYEAKKDK